MAHGLLAGLFLGFGGLAGWIAVRRMPDKERVAAIILGMALALWSFITRPEEYLRAQTPSVDVTAMSVPDYAAALFPLLAIIAVSLFLLFLPYRLIRVSVLAFWVCIACLLFLQMFLQLGAA